VPLEPGISGGISGGTGWFFEHLDGDIFSIRNTRDSIRSGVFNFAPEPSPLSCGSLGVFRQETQDTQSCRSLSLDPCCPSYRPHEALAAQGILSTCHSHQPAVLESTKQLLEFRRENTSLRPGFLPKVPGGLKFSWP